MKKVVALILTPITDFLLLITREQVSSNTQWKILALIANTWNDFSQRKRYDQVTEENLGAALGALAGNLTRDSF